jgi:hypothetical protein
MSGTVPGIQRRGPPRFRRWSLRSEVRYNNDMAEPKNPVIEAADRMAGAQDADVLFYNAPIRRPTDDRIIELVSSRRRRKNVVLILVSEGGDPDAAYRIARCLQASYKRFTLLCGGYCKSAATLVALGAHELILSDCGELGPLDVQMSKTDEIMQVQSGLTVTSALATLNQQSLKAFDHFFIQTIRRLGQSVSTRTATNIAVQLTTGLFAPIYEHVDPMHIGEAGRALQVAVKYGQLLQVKSGNLQADALDVLATGYPSHGFVIDRTQAEDLFKIVKAPDAMEQALLTSLGTNAQDPMPRDGDPMFLFLSTERADNNVRSAPSNPQPAGTGAGDAATQSVDDAQPVPATGSDRGRQDEAAREPHLAEVRQITSRAGS